MSLLIHLAVGTYTPGITPKLAIIMKVTSLFMFVYEYALCHNAIMLMILGIGSENNHTSVLGFC